MSQALVAFVILVAQVGEYLAELLFCQDGLEGVTLAPGVVEPHAPCRHQRGAEPLALVEHGLIGMAYQMQEILRLPVYGNALPPDNLVGLPMGTRCPLGIVALLGARLPLLVAVLLLQGLEKPLHAAAQHPVKGEGIAAKVGQHLCGIVAVRPYIYGLAPTNLPSHDQMSKHILSFLIGDSAGARTQDLHIKSVGLYLLSYRVII